MVVLTHARQLRLNPPPSATISSVIYDPTSLTLALMHPDSSFSLYPHISPFSPPPSTTTTTVVSPPSSSATFLRLRTTTYTNVMFIISSPYLAGTSILLRFYIIRNDNQFARVRVICNQSDLAFDEKKLGVLVKVNHGVSVKLAASINVFTMYSVSDRKVRVYAVKSVGEGDVVKLMRTAVIDCEVPVFAVSVSTGFLILGEGGGVRVFPLRPLVKGRKMSDKISEKAKVQKLKLVNGSSGLYAKTGRVNGSVEDKIGKHYDSSVKMKPLKLRQNSQECGVRFVPFKSKEFEDYESSKGPLMMSVKAVSVQFLAHNKFLVLDSDGELYLLSLSNHASGSESGHEMKKLTLAMKVKNLAVLPDDSAIAGTKTVWLSDGQYTIHAIILSDMDSTAAGENETNIEEKIQRSATQVIFTSEKIQEIVPLSANAILLLGQANNIFAYAIS